MEALLIALCVLAGLLRALHDTLTHEPGGGKPAGWGAFWNSQISWRFKYRDADPALGPRFPGSTTWLVAFTDGWHLSNLLSWGAMGGAVVVATWCSWEWAAAGVVAGKVIFEPVYQWLRK